MKPLKSGAPLDAGTQWKLMYATRYLKTSFNGMALTGFMVACSQHEDNGAETWASLKWGETCSKLKSDVGKPKSVNIKKHVAQLE